jgi:hypothetical protein
MLSHQTLRGRLMPLTLMTTLCVLIGLGVVTKSGFSAMLPQHAPSKPPRGYSPIIPCQSQLGQVWAHPSASQPPNGNTPPMLGFHQDQLTGMVFYLSEKHLYPLLPRGGRWNFNGTINATVDSITLTPAQLRPNRDNRGYELTVMIHQETPVTVTCAGTTTTASPEQSGAGSNNQDGGVSNNKSGSGTGGFSGGGMKKSK